MMAKRKTTADRLREMNAMMDAEIEKACRRASDREKKGRGDSDVPKLWRSRYYLRQGYHLGKVERRSGRHWQGGPPRHRGAKCHICKRPLALIWDIGCSDARFRRESPDVFDGLERLPLYFCCHCPSPTVYRCTEPDTIKVLSVAPFGDEPPFQNIPEFFPRRPIALEPIPADIENLIQLCQCRGSDWLRRSDRRALAQYLGESSSSFIDPRRSQFGGILVLEQGHEEHPCPNRRCPTHSWGSMMRQKEYYMMKQLAVIDDDAGLEMETYCAQIIFYLCWACHTVLAEYQID
jgi:hypothetical protein